MLSYKNVYTDPVPWNMKDVFRLVLFFLLVSIISALFGVFLGLIYIHFPIMKKIIPFSDTYPIVDIAYYVFTYFYIMKRWILSKYDGGMKILLESRNNKAFFVIAAILGACIGIPIFALNNYEIRRSTLLMPFLPFLLQFISAILFAAIVEEIVFRSFIYRAFKKKIGVIGSIFITTIIFTSTHFGSYFHPVLLIQIFVFSFLVNILYEKTGSLYACILAHSSYNFVYGVVSRYFPL